MRSMKMKMKMALVLAIVMMLTGCEQEETGFQEVSAEELDEKGESEEKAEVSENFFVHVCGQVNEAGVYELPEGSRVYEAIEAAGGLRENAAAESLNQAQSLEDGQQIYVPSKEEILAQETAGGIRSDGKVNLNKANSEELMTLPGIGEAKAEAIIRYREQQGSFKSIEDIMEIEGIKEGVFRKIEGLITIS